jgi:hypothetical protein
MSERCFFSKKARDAWSSTLLNPQENIISGLLKRLIGLSPPPCANCSTEFESHGEASKEEGGSGSEPEDLMA